MGEAEVRLLQAKQKLRDTDSRVTVYLNAGDIVEVNVKQGDARTYVVLWDGTMEEMQ